MIRVLITGCSMHSLDLINAMRANENGEEIYVVGINCSDTALLRNGVNAGYVVPPITDPEYKDIVIDICKKEKVDVILPFITAEIPLMAEWKDEIEAAGIKVSVTSPESLAIVGNKIDLSARYGEYMPKQKVVKSHDDIEAFIEEIGYPQTSMCCKLPDRCGGLGFAVIDDEKGKDFTLFNKFGLNRYITLNMFYELFDALEDKEIILQEYEEGSDYSMCILADHGKLLYGLGFEGLLMAFGSAMFARINQNDEALEIARRITEESGLDGNACFDFMLKPDGHVVLLEVNPRVSATLPFIAKAGMNLPYLRCRQLLGYDVSKVNMDINYSLRMSKNYESEYF